MNEEIRRKYKDEVIPILTIREAEQAIRGAQYNAVLKTELVPMEDIKKMLHKIGMEQITVIGFEGV